MGIIFPTVRAKKKPERQFNVGDKIRVGARVTSGRNAGSPRAHHAGPRYLERPRYVLPIFVHADQKIYPLIPMAYVVIGAMLNLKDDVMSSWSVICAECKSQVIYSNIDSATMERCFSDPFRIIPKPAGEKRICPNCKAESTFAATQMFYREEKNVPTVSKLP